MMSSRSPGVMTRVPGLKYSMAWLEFIAPMMMLDAAAAMRIKAELIKRPRISLQICGSVGLERSGSAGMAPSRFDAAPFQAAPGEVANMIELFRKNFVEITPTISTPSLSKSAWFKAHLVDGPSDAAFGDEQHLACKQLGHAGVGKIEDRADAGMPGALDDAKLLFPAGAVKELRSRRTRKSLFELSI